MRMTFHIGKVDKERSLEEVHNNIRKGIAEKLGIDNQTPDEKGISHGYSGYVHSVFPNHAILQTHDGTFHKVKYTADEQGNVTDVSDPKEVEHSWSPVSKGTHSNDGSAADMKESITKDGHPASDFLVVEDPKESSTWHLPVYDEAHCAAAHAALMSEGGDRGNKYAGPDKEKAIAKLKSAYKRLKMPWPEDKKE